VVHWARRAASGEALARRQVKGAAFGMSGDFVTHQRHADEIGDRFCLHQTHGLACVPARHEDQLAANREGLEEQRHFAGYMEQRHRHQCAGLLSGGWGHAAHGEDVQAHHRLRHIAQRAVHHAPVVGISALRLSGRAGGVEDGGEIVRAEFGQRCRGGVTFRPHGGQPIGRVYAMRDTDERGGMRAAFQALRARVIDQHQRTFGKLDPLGQLLARPEPVEQRGAAARQQHAHIGDRPVGRVARRNADPVAFLHPMS
jgi:hypothetical protein